MQIFPSCGSTYHAQTFCQISPEIDYSQALTTIDGAHHFSLTNINNPPGALPDPSNPTLAQNEAIETIARWSALFLRATVLDDAEASELVFDAEADLAPNVSIVAEVEPVPEPSALLGLLIATVGSMGWRWQRK